MDGGGGRHNGRGRGSGRGGYSGGRGGRGSSTGSFQGDGGGRGGRGGGRGGRSGYRGDDKGFGGGSRGRGGRTGGGDRHENGFGGGRGPGGGGGRGAARGDSAPRGGKRSNGPPQAALNLDEDFCMLVHAQLQELVEDGSRNEMSFPVDLDNHQRRYIHSVAEKYGLFTKSSGKGDTRFIHVAKVKKNANMQQISLRLPPIKANTATMSWFPPTVIQYLQQYPLSAVPSNQDPWASGELTPSWIAHHAVEHRQKTSPPLFKPLRQNARPSQSPKNRPKPTVATLPVHSYREQILEYVERNQVVVISGDTGCGKSTQIPQFLLDDMIAKGKAGETRIICSQPRRLSAISLAERVAKERSGLGGDPIEVGHAIRFDSSFDSHKSKLIFCTTGTLLKWLNSDPMALGFSHLILDEVHERDQFTDFLLILLKSSILKRRKDLKVILMSATIQVEKFAEYFQPEFEAPVLEMVGGRCFPVTTLFLEDLLALIHHANTSGGAAAITQHSARDLDRGEDDDDSDDDGDVAGDSGLQCPMCQTGGFLDEESFGMHVATCFGVPSAATPTLPKVEKPKKQKKPATTKKAVSRPPAALGDMLRGALEVVGDDVKTNLLANYVRQEDALSRDQSVDYSLLLQLLYMIEQVFPLHDADSQGAILVFLPGWEEISYMERELLRSHLTASTYEIAMLHSRLSAQEQRRAFLKPPRGKRKVILATNIAETSLTIEDVVFVIDCGKSKQAHALATTSSSSFVMGLQTTWVAKANCVQRMGRAGRVRPGVCFRLFSKSRYETAMKEFMIPELLTTPLEELMLHIKLLQFEKKLHIADAKEFLMLAMDSPSETAIDASLDRLEVMSALDRSKKLTLLGWHLAHICDSGVSVHVGKLLLWSHIFGGFDAIVRTTCALSGYRDPFLNFLGMTSDELRQVEASKQTFLRHAGSPFHVQSDHFMLLLAMEGYLQFHPREHREIDAFCRNNMLHRPTLDQVTSIYRQLERDLEQLGMTEASQLVGSSAAASQQQQQRLQAPFSNRRQASAPVARWTAERLAPFFMALGAGLYPNVLSTRPIPGSRNWTSKEKVKVRLDSSSMLNKGGNGASNGRNKKGRNGDDDDDDDETSGNGLEWMVYHEMMQSERTRVAKNATKLPTSLILLLFVGNADQIVVEESQDEVASPQGDGSVVLVTKWTMVIDEWLVFEFGTMEEVQAILTLRARLQAAFYRHLDRLHESHLVMQHQQFQDLPPRGRAANGTHAQQPPPVPATVELPHNPTREVWRQHDAQLVSALVGWITSDLPTV